MAWSAPSIRAYNHRIVRNVAGMKGVLTEHRADEARLAARRDSIIVRDEGTKKAAHFHRARAGLRRWRAIPVLNFEASAADDGRKEREQEFNPCDHCYACKSARWRAPLRPPDTPRC